MIWIDFNLYIQKSNIWLHTLFYGRLYKGVVLAVFDENRDDSVETFVGSNLSHIIVLGLIKD